MVGFAVVAVAFMVVGIPVIGIIGLRAYSMWLRDKQIRGLLEERRALIEGGVTDLPPLELPEVASPGTVAEVPLQALPIMAKGKLRSTNLGWAGLILLLVAGWTWAWQVSERSGPNAAVLAWIALILTATGLLMLFTHLIVRTFGRRVYAVSEVADRPAEQRLEVVRGDPLRNMKAGIVLLFLSATFVAWDLLTPTSVLGFRPQLQIAIILGGIGLALLVIHALAGYYERQEQEPPG